MSAIRGRIRIFRAQLLNEAGDIHLRSDISALMDGLNGRESIIPFEVFDDYRLFAETGDRFCDDGAVAPLRPRVVGQNHGAVDPIS